ncbi:MAG TPA: DUF885 family protein [Myxococcales bacterium]|nr:DUF885 family protein [Myxococcales bacterium]
MTHLPLLFAVLVAQATPQDLQARRKQLSDLLDEQWEYTMRTHPEYASVLGDKRYNDKLSDRSEKAILAELEVERQFLARFKAIDVSGFPEQEALNKALMVREMELDLAGVRFKDWEMPVTQFGGIHIQAPQIVSLLSFETVKDYDDYIARLQKLPVAFAQTTDLMRKGMADKLMPPRILLEQVARQSAKIGETAPEDNPFFAPAKKIPAGFAEADKARIREQMLAAVRDGVKPAYQAFTRFVQEEYAPQGRAEPGIWALPEGKDRYAYAVEQATTTRMQPEEIHQIGLREVARDRALMLKIAKKLGYEDLKSFDAAIAKNPKLHPASREQMLELYRKYIDQMWAKLPQYFGRLPKAKVEVMPVEEYREKEASGAQYVNGTPDGKRPGHVMVNTGQFEKRTTLDIETTAYHEGVPGHHLQLSIAQELPTLPKFRQHAFYIAFIEGWGLYSERLGEDAGFFQDPYSLYGHLQDDLLRAIRLVVDTGFHYKKWSRAQVIDYFHANSGLDEPTVQSETDRYMAWPAQALGYKIGQLKILELRDRARKELGPRFDIRAFHDEVLGGGAMPLDILDQRLADWTARNRQGAVTGPSLR